MSYELAPRYAPRRRRPLRAALLGAGVVVLLCGIGAAGLAVWSYQSVRGSAGPARVAAERFLDRLAAGDTAGAHEQLCADTRRRWPREDFTREVAGAAPITGYAVSDVDVVTRSGRPRASVTVRLTRLAGPAEQRAVPVLREGGTWRVCGDPF